MSSHLCSPQFLKLNIHQNYQACNTMLHSHFSLWINDLPLARSFSTHLTCSVLIETKSTTADLDPRFLFPLLVARQRCVKQTVERIRCMSRLLVPLHSLGHNFPLCELLCRRLIHFITLTIVSASSTWSTNETHRGGQGGFFRTPIFFKRCSAFRCSATSQYYHWQL